MSLSWREAFIRPCVLRNLLPSWAVSEGDTCSINRSESSRKLVFILCTIHSALLETGYS